jgi:glycerol-3-phosphate dehydrogenase (NAD(P)+)
MRMVAEGVRTTEAALDLGKRHGVELPIAAQIADVLAGRRAPKEAVGELMLRPQRDEVDGPFDGAQGVPSHGRGTAVS